MQSVFRFRPVLVLLVLALAVSIVAAAADTKKARKLTEKGRKLLAENRFEEGLKELDKAIKEDAKYPLAHYYRGFALGNVGREQEARDAFLRATELNPAWAEAHRMVAMASYNIGDFETAWEHAIRAHQAGVDMSQGFEMLKQVSQPPPGLDDRLEAPRVFVEDLDLSGVLNRNENPFGRQADNFGDSATGGSASGSAGDLSGQTAGALPNSGASVPTSDNANAAAGTKAMGVGARLVSEAQSDLFELLRQTREAVADSPVFGLVPKREMADYVLVVKVDDMGDLGEALQRKSQQKVIGYIKLLDPESGEQIYRRLLELKNISATGDLNADLERYMGYLEEWQQKQGR